MRNRLKMSQGYENRSMSKNKCALHAECAAPHNGYFVCILYDMSIKLYIFHSQFAIS